MVYFVEHDKSSTVLSIEMCRGYLDGIPLTDKQVESLRDALYSLVENVLDDYIETFATIEPTCKNQSSIAESPQSDKKQKVTDWKAKSTAVVN